MKQYSYWQQLWVQFKHHRLGYMALWILLAFTLAAIYAPFLASSKPLLVVYDGTIYFPLFRYLFYPKFFSKNLDLFFNLLIFTFPLGCLVMSCWKSVKAFFLIALLQLALFAFILLFPMGDPAASANTPPKQSLSGPSWQQELSGMSPYRRLNLILEYQQQKSEGENIARDLATMLPAGDPFLEHIPTLWQIDRKRKQEQLERENKTILRLKAEGKQQDAAETGAAIAYVAEREQWLESESRRLKLQINPLLTSFHWEEDAGGSQHLNQYLPWWKLTRLNHKSLLAALIFGIRISLVVGLMAVSIALAIAIPVGSIAGFYGGTVDIIICRLLEVWESMPTFFMLLLIVAVTQSKSIFLVIAVIGFFGWTSFSRFLRGEFFKQRHLPYVEACHAIGFPKPYIIFLHILPNAIPPLLTLLPFAIMGAIASESGLSFLGLGEEDSCSWGVLMDEGRASFPAQSALLWPPAFLLTLLLVSIALVGDALRDTLDPKLHKVT